MILDEAIKKAEEVAEEQEKLCKRYPNAIGYTHWLEYAEEHRQLAEWLKDYKRLLEQELVLDKIREEINSPNRGTCDYFIVDNIEEIIDKYKASPTRAESRE